MDGDFKNLGRLFAIKYDPLYHVPREKNLCIPRERGNKKVFSAKKKTGNAFNIIGIVCSGRILGGVDCSAQRLSLYLSLDTTLYPPLSHTLPYSSTLSPILSLLQYQVPYSTLHTPTLAYTVILYIPYS